MKLLPKEEKFFVQLNSQTRIIEQAAVVLLEGVERGNSHLKMMAPRIQQYEQEGDEILHDVFKRLNQTFITPIDPEDIHSLCAHLDDVLDGIEDVAHRLVAYKIEPIPEPVIEICRFVQVCSMELSKAVAALDGHQQNEIIERCIEINRLEDQVDKLGRQAVMDLFDSETDPIRVMKLKEIYDHLEFTVDACEDVADALQNVVVKNS